MVWARSQKHFRGNKPDLARLSEKHKKHGKITGDVWGPSTAATSPSEKGNMFKNKVFEMPTPSEHSFRFEGEEEEEVEDDEEEDFK